MALLSHGRTDSDQLAQAVQAAYSRIESAGSAFDRDAMIADLELWQQSEFGQWMLCNGGWNGYWTRYAVSYPVRRANGEPAPANDAERFFLEKAPGIVGTQQRFQHFQDVLGSLVIDGSVAVSVPCGVMDDLLTLPDLPDTATLIGLDLDADSLDLAWQTATEAGRQSQVTLGQADAWDLPGAVAIHGEAAAFGLLAGRADVLTSNGLNIYVAQDERVVELYRSFRRALKPGGVLVTSALTPPKQWSLTGMDPADLKRAQGLLLINGVGWANYRTVEATRQQLEAAGFDVAEVRPDNYWIYPTFVARAR